jgi:hypothetical protein
VQQEAALVIALQALGWLAADEDRLARFLALSGAGVGDLRGRAAEPEFLAAVLDHLMAEDALIIAFAEAESLPPDSLIRARAALPGGDLPHWT